MNVWKAMRGTYIHFSISISDFLLISILYTLAIIKESALFVILDLAPDPQWHLRRHFLHCQQMVSFFYWRVTSTSLLCMPVMDVVVISSVLLVKWEISSLYWDCDKALSNRGKMAKTILVWCPVLRREILDPLKRQVQSYLCSQRREWNVLRLRANSIKADEFILFQK